MGELSSIHPLGDLAKIEGDGGSAVKLNIKASLSCIQVFAKRGCETDVIAKLKLEGKPGQAIDTRTFVALPLSPGQWMLISKKIDESFAMKISAKLKGIGYVSQQSESRICIRVSGSRARDLLCRGCRLDLHESVATKGFCAQTPMAQVGVLLHQIDDAPIYDLYVYSGFARSFWHWIEHTAAQFGYSVGVLD